jgi:hypothetical protein
MNKADNPAQRDSNLPDEDVKVEDADAINAEQEKRLRSDKMAMLDNRGLLGRFE